MQTIKSSPIIIRLDAHAREISVAEIKKQIYNKLEREGRNPQSGYFPFSTGRKQQLWSRSGDFRDKIMAGLEPTPPSDESAGMQIKQALMNDVKSLVQMYAKSASKTDDVHPGSVIAQMKQQRLGRLVFGSLTEQDMREYAMLVIRARIEQMLKDSQLVVNVPEGKPIVYLDDLVAWACAQHIDIEQKAMPGCEAFIEASYRRFHQKRQAVPQPSAPVVTSSAKKNTGPDWKARACEIADEVGLMKWRQGQQEITKRNIAARVAMELAKDPVYHSNRGPRAEGSVRNALTGWEFVRPVGTSGTNGTNK